jgi:hypothetical protein
MTSATRRPPGPQEGYAERLHRVTFYGPKSGAVFINYLTGSEIEMARAVLDRRRMTGGEVWMLEADA